jgi:hypothetical protein
MNNENKKAVDIAIKLIKERINYLLDAEFEEINKIDQYPVGSLLRKSAWMLIHELAHRRSENEEILKSINKLLAPAEK